MKTSQILEPMVCGILTYFKNGFWLGSQNNYPVIVTQRVKKEIRCEWIKNYMQQVLQILGNSFFDRLIHPKWCAQRSVSVGILHEQGPNASHVYGFCQYTLLWRCFDAFDGVSCFKQTFFPGSIQINWIEIIDKSSFEWRNRRYQLDQWCWSRCNGFILSKTHRIIWNESYATAQKKYWCDHATERRLLWSSSRWRAFFTGYCRKITVDTVERYQGGARDIIIISFLYQQDFTNWITSLWMMSMALT